MAHNHPRSLFVDCGSVWMDGHSAGPMRSVHICTTVKKHALGHSTPSSHINIVHPARTRGSCAGRAHLSGMSGNEVGARLLVQP